LTATNLARGEAESNINLTVAAKKRADDEVAKVKLTISQHETDALANKALEDKAVQRMNESKQHENTARSNQKEAKRLAEEADWELKEYIATELEANNAAEAAATRESEADTRAM